MEVALDGQIVDVLLLLDEPLQHVEQCAPLGWLVLKEGVLGQCILCLQLSQLLLGSRRPLLPFTNLAGNAQQVLHHPLGLEGLAEDVVDGVVETQIYDQSCWIW